MAEVERAGHVRRRLDDDEPIRARRRLGAPGVKAPLVHPALVDRAARPRRRRSAGRARVASSSSVQLLHRHTQNPFVEGRTGRGTTFVRGRPVRSAGAVASLLRAIGRTRPARVRPSPSRVRGGLSAVARLSGAADGGVLLTVNAEIRVYHPRCAWSASALERDAQAALGSVLDLRAFPLELGDRGCARRTRPRGWRGRRTRRSGPGSARPRRCRRRRTSAWRNPVIAPKLPRPLTTTSVVADSPDAAGAGAASGSAAARGSAGGWRRARRAAPRGPPPRPDARRAPARGRRSTPRSSAPPAPGRRRLRSLPAGPPPRRLAPPDRRSSSRPPELRAACHRGSAAPACAWRPPRRRRDR